MRGGMIENALEEYCRRLKHTYFPKPGDWVLVDTLTKRATFYGEPTCGEFLCVSHEGATAFAESQMPSGEWSMAIKQGAEEWSGIRSTLSNSQSCVNRMEGSNSQTRHRIIEQTDADSVSGTGQLTPEGSVMSFADW